MAQRDDDDDNSNVEKIFELLIIFLRERFQP